MVGDLGGQRASVVGQHVLLPLAVVAAGPVARRHVESVRGLEGGHAKVRRALPDHLQGFES